MTTNTATGPFRTLENIAKVRWYRFNSPLSKDPAFQSKLFFHDLGLVFGAIGLGIILTILFIGGSKASSTSVSESTGSSISQSLGYDSNGEVQYSKIESVEKSQIIMFESSGGVALNTGGRLAPSIASPGTLLRAKLQNELEVVGSAPAFAQIIDHGLGKQFFGASLIGEARVNSQSGRLEFTWNLLKPEFPRNLAHLIDAISLSLNGTLGLVAETNGNFAERVGISTMRGGAQGLESMHDKNGGAGSIENVLTRALLKGLGAELDRDLTIQQNNSIAYKVKPGTEFLVQLTDYFPKDHP